MTWQTIHWIAGSILGLVWLSRTVEAALGMPRIADITRPEWDRRPATAEGEPRVSIIVPACNEEEHIRETLVRLLALEYANYEVIAVNDRSTDRTGQIMDEIAAGAECGADIPVRVPAASALQTEADRNVRPTRLKVIHIHGTASRLAGQDARHVDSRQTGERRLAAVHRCRRALQARFVAARHGLRRSPRRRTMWSCFRA